MARAVAFLSLLVLLLPAWLPAQSGPAAASNGVTLRPGDVLKIEIWREEDLSGEFLVDEEGIVTLPLLGERQVTGIPLRRLREELLEAYRVQLRNPSISVTPLRRIHVLGEVNKPGLYELDPTISLAAVVALAGGATPTGDLNRIRVIRGNQIIRKRVGAAEAVNAIDIRSGDQILVDRRSWFERNSTFVISVALGAPSIIAGFIGLINALK